MLVAFCDLLAGGMGVALVTRRAGLVGGPSVPVVCAAVTLAGCQLQRPGGPVVGQPERDEPAQIEGGGAVVQPVVVLGHAAIANLAVAADQPGDGAFHNRPMLPIFVLPGRVSRIMASNSLQRIMRADAEGPTGDAGGAARPQGAAAARGFERRRTGAADAAGDTGGAGHGAVDMVDSEIVDGEPAGDSRTSRCGV